MFSKGHLEELEVSHGDRNYMEKDAGFSDFFLGYSFYCNSFTEIIVDVRRHFSKEAFYRRGCVLLLLELLLD